MSSNSFVLPNDMSDLCRVCLQLPDETQYLDLSTIYDEEDNLTYSECFTICTQIDLNAGEGVPHYLCKPCGIELQMSYDFHKKIEESKRVVEQCQRQLKEETLNRTELQSNTEESENINLSEQENKLTVHVIDEKYVISEGDMQDDESSTETQMVYETQQHNDSIFADSSAPTDEPDEVEVINECKNESDLRCQVILDKLSNEEMNEDHFEIEALEEEEKRRKLVTNINVKKEALNKEQNIQIKDECKEITEVQSENTISPEKLLDSNFVKIKSEILNECSGSLTNINAEEIKIENENVGEYIVCNPTVPTQLICSLKNLQQEESQRLEPPFNCKFCGHSVPTKNSLYKHVQRKHKHEKCLDKKVVQTSANCPFCYKLFSRMVSLRLHITEKHSSKSFVCEYCGHNVPTKNALCQHRLRKHPEAKKLKVVKFKCPKCSEPFETEESLNLHKERKHFKKRNPAAEHSWIHCPDCGYKLPTRNALYQHRLRKHRTKKERIL